MQRLTSEEQEIIKGGKTYIIQCWGKNRPSQTDIRTCFEDFIASIKKVAEYSHGRHIKKTGHIWAKFNW